MNDKTTKALLFAIALGLWANAAASLVRPKELYAQSDPYMSQIAHDVHGIYSGVCINTKVC
jgi:hypothetical protein